MSRPSVGVDLGLLSALGVEWRVAVGSDISRPNSFLTVQTGVVRVRVHLEGERAKWSFRAQLDLHLVIAPGARIILRFAESLPFLQLQSFCV